MTHEEQQIAIQMLTFQPSEESIKLATGISQLMQQYEQSVVGKSVIQGKQASDFALTSQKLLVQYILQAQNDMVSYTTTVGGFLFQQYAALAEAQIEPEPIIVVAIAPEVSNEILQQLSDYSDFGKTLADEAIPAIRKALADSATEEQRKEALLALTETEEVARDMVKEMHQLAAMVEEATYDETDDLPEEEEEEEEDLITYVPRSEKQPVTEDEYEDLVG